MKTIVFVDVDGVINAVPNRRDDLSRVWPADTWREGYVYFEEFAFEATITWSTEVVDRLRALEQRDGVEMWWCTTWREKASEQLSPLIGGLGRNWPHVDRLPRPRGPHNWWKADHVLDVFRSGRYDKIIWIDDDISAHTNTLTMSGRDDDWQWMLDEGIITLSPLTREGLAPEDFELIERFLQ